MRIDQWVPALHRGDAIGDSARLMRDAFRSWGHTADVYTLDLDDDLRDDGRPFSSWAPGGPDDVLILHFAIPSPLSAAFREHRGRRVLLHHNITPGEFFDPWDEEMARICRVGRQELASLAPHVDLGLGDSEFNRQELEALGVRETGVLPIFIDFARYREQPSPVLRRLLGDERTNLLFVGRIAPNKRIEDLIRLASYWKRFVSPAVRLVLVGRLPRRATGHGVPLLAHYFDALQAFAYEEGLQPDEVVFTGHVRHDDLLAAYATASVFVSMSEHEGFGVPLVEAMLADVPVLARGAAAVPDTLGGAGVLFDTREIAELGDLGVLFDTREIAEIGEMAHRLAEDQALRTAVLAGQRQRLQRFAPASVEADLRRFVESVSGEARGR